ncbi:MAG: hypothetical protein O9332_01230 [Microcystis sp. LE19-10.1B]|uniref:hypothetical protein n=1 Tax=Microcystis sp. LE19-10.1B TaxID=3016428 RepID=UPI0022C66F13|nr:hypothetical protein [Microcystis sp. LE19-10.1B]MCZ8024126.1 hypothetical protein [Microcystis sp. LE19-10.1B]MCZ8365429.1 hypothetical protein [Microcystis sp. LE19-251.1A]
MGLKITQFGGGWGNKAGDCCLLTYGKKMDRHTLIDLGAPQVKRKYCHLGIQADHTLENVIFTHLHEDHIGNDTQWKEVVERCTNKIFLPSKTTLTKKLEKIIKHPKINHATISFPDDDQDSQELSLNNDDDLKVTIKFIIPDPNKFKFKEAERTESDEDKIENEKSLGCLITVEKDEKKMADANSW